MGNGKCRGVLVGHGIRRHGYDAGHSPRTVHLHRRVDRRPENKHRKRTEAVVHFLDTDLDRNYRLSPDTYGKLRVNSEKETSDLLANQNDKASYYRNVAFRLSAAVKNRLATLPLVES